MLIVKGASSEPVLTNKKPAAPPKAADPSALATPVCSDTAAKRTAAIITASHAETPRRMRATMQKARQNSCENEPSAMSPHQVATGPRDSNSLRATSGGTFDTGVRAGPEEPG